MSNANSQLGRQTDIERGGEGKGEGNGQTVRL